MKKIRHLRAIFWIFLVIMALGLPRTLQKEVLAAEEGSITVQLNNLDTPKNDVGFTAYRVGSWSGEEGKWVLDDSLKDTGVELDKLEYATDLDSAALKLASAKGLENIDHVVSGKTDGSGTMQLTGLPWGVYLLVQNSGESEYGTVSPLLAAIPYVTDGSRQSDLTVEPKAKAPVKEADGRIEVTKRAGYMDPEALEVVDLIPSDAVYYVGIFQDKAGKVPYGTDYIKEIHMAGIGTGTAAYENLSEGTYYIFETDRNGNAYIPDEVQTDASNTWVCQIENGSSQEVTLDGKAETPAGSVAFYNLYYNLPDGFSYQGTVNIEKKVMEDGEKTTSSDIFYAGIFRDKKGTDLYQVTELVSNGTVSVNVPLGGESGEEKITYYIYETDKEGNLIDKDSFGYTVSGEGKVTLEPGKLSQDIAITNTKKSGTDENSGNGGNGGQGTPGSQGTSGNGSGGSGNNQGTDRVRTGDETPVAFYIGLLAAAFAVIVVLVGYRYQKGRKRHE